MYTLFLIFHIFVSILLILIVLVQVGRGAEMGAAFGGVGQAQFPKTPENYLGKLTTYLAVSFMILSLILAVLSSRNSNNSILDDTLEIQRIIEDSTTDATPLQ